uniref:Putative ovule protein n=1 Tax=Solanum chacoense TaxID=4108 RepID=A0A0V0H8S6_SOLCH
MKKLSVRLTKKKFHPTKSQDKTITTYSPTNKSLSKVKEERFYVSMRDAYMFITEVLFIYENVLNYLRSRVFLYYDR